eukprot:1769538-Heterocapsa_arctica.AAC.1
MEILAESITKRDGVDYSYRESISTIVGVYMLYTWRGWSQLSTGFKYIPLNSSRGRKSTPRDLIVGPLARIIGGK